MATSAEIAAQIAALQKQAEEAAKREEEERASRPPGVDQVTEAVARADAEAAREHDRLDVRGVVAALHEAVRAIGAYLALSASASVTASTSTDSDTTVKEGE